MKQAILLLFLWLLHLPSDAAEPRRYRLTLNFSEPAFRWSRTITYREEFHLILDNAPLGAGYWGFVTGVIYPKEQVLHVSLSLSKMRGKSDADGAALGHISHVKLPSSLEIPIPMLLKVFKRCTATFTPVK